RELLTNEAFLLNCLRNREEIRKTNWFKSFEGPDGKANFVMAKENLLDNLKVREVAETKLVMVSMTWNKPDDTKVIVQEIVQQHLDDQRSKAQTKLMERTQRVN